MITSGNGGLLLPEDFFRLMKEKITMSKEKERLRKLIEQQKEQMDKESEKEDPDPGVDYAELYKEQTGKDLFTDQFLQ
jgi:hypothetical protein